MEKYQKLSDLLYSMIDRKVVNRPNCKEILERKHEWALSEKELDARKELEKANSSDKKSYVYSMIKLKLNAFLL